MNVLITGGSGFVGAALARELARRGHAPQIVSRRPGSSVTWDDASLARGVERADAVVHLAGENLFAKRWSTRQKEALWRSRHETTRKLAKLVAERKPRVFVSASAVGFYGASPDATFDERSPRGEGFLAELCADWEAAADAALEAGVRTAIVRFGVVLERGGGALARMLPIFQLGLGGPLGDGKQWVSWIHRADAVSLIIFLLERDGVYGLFNATAPNPVTMKELARELGRALHRPAVLPAPAPMLRLALGEVADVLLTGQRVLPRRAQEAGFAFEHPELAGALQEIVSKEAPAHAG
ncbi:MAG: TIGR01777 family oxidoreductase [Planctomycetota bacterium]